MKGVFLEALAKKPSFLDATLLLASRANEGVPCVRGNHASSYAAALVALVALVALFALLGLSGCTEPSEYCDANQELDLRLARLPAGTWLCSDYYVVTIDAEGRPRAVRAGAAGDVDFSCKKDDHYPLVEHDRNVRAGKQPDMGGKAWVGYARELVHVVLEADYLLLTYEQGYTDASKSVFQFAFRVDANNNLGYAGAAIADFPLTWSLCEPVDELTP